MKYRPLLIPLPLSEIEGRRAGSRITTTTTTSTTNITTTKTTYQTVELVPKLLGVREQGKNPQARAKLAVFVSMCLPDSRLP